MGSRRMKNNRRRTSPGGERPENPIAPVTGGSWCGRHHRLVDPGGVHMRRISFMRVRAALALGAILLVSHGAEAVAKARPKPKVHKVAPKKAKKKVVKHVVVPVPVPVVAMPVAVPPPAPPAPIEDVADYRWIDDADALAKALDGSAPDFTFRYGNDEDWAWQTSDGHMMLVEPVGDERREYYFGAGASYPFLIRDGYFSYGFTGDGLAVVYDADGRLSAWQPDDLRSVTARRLFERGIALRLAARERRGGGGASWALQGDFWTTLLFDFTRERNNGGWRRYRHTHRGDHGDHDRRYADDWRRRHGGPGLHVAGTPRGRAPQAGDGATPSVTPPSREPGARPPRRAAPEPS